MLTDARFKFALESLKKCTLMESKTNIFFSPHLIYHGLLVTYFGAIGDTESSLRKVLYIPDDLSKAIVQQYYFFGGVNQFCYIMNRPASSYTCRIFSRLFINECKVLYVETMNLFSSGHQVKELNFDVRPEHARNFVNNSVKCITQACIQNVLPPNSINNNTDAILLNVIYCKGQLDHNFDLDMTPDLSVRKKMRKDKRHTTNQNVNNGKSEELDAYIMELSFKEKKISTFLFFPSGHSPIEGSSSEKDRIIQLLERLTTENGSQELRKLLDDGLPQQTDMLFPTFNIHQHLEIHRLLDMLSLREFTPSGAGELKEFTCNSVKLSDAVHRASIEMTSTSITATACNVFFTDNARERARMNPIVDMCLPCICLIYDKCRCNILFCGVLSEN